MEKDLIKKLKDRLHELSHLTSTIALLEWDTQVHMPPKANDRRGATIAYLTSLLHSRFLELDSDKTLSRLRKELELGNLSKEDEVVVKGVTKSYDRTIKLPKSFVEELSNLTSKANLIWAEARKNSDFKAFLPTLRKIIELKRKEAEFVGYKNSPYDALLDTYEPEFTAEEASKILSDLKQFLIPFVAKIAKNHRKIQLKLPDFKGEFPIDKQFTFNKFIAEKVGYDFEAGGIEKSVHPFTATFHPEDVRFTTRYDKNNLFYAIGSTIHEAGHALYEQGLPKEHFGTPLAEAISFGIHESQSRFWENIIGKSRPFWKYLYPKIQKEFPKPFKNIPLENVYQAINQIRPSFIRTEADEASYNLHIIVRFEIEKEMIEGSIPLEDLPKIWNSKMEEYLGVIVPNDAKGLLQDVHWSNGYIGYFPSYALGNLYAAQIYSKMRKDLLNFDKEVAIGQFGHIREWLRKNIHVHGKMFTPEELMKKLTGEGLNSRYFVDYLEAKYGS